MNNNNNKELSAFTDFPEDSLPKHFIKNWHENLVKQINIMRGNVNGALTAGHTVY
jgi:hypothetical protein